MRMAAASWCLRLALRLDPEIPLRHLAATRNVHLERGVRNTWVVLSIFDDRTRADEFTSWASAFPLRYPLTKDNP